MSISAPFVAYACGMSPMLQEIMSITFECIWCGKKDIHPKCRTQVTCGRYSCGEKQNRYKSQSLTAIRSGRASVFACGAVQPNALRPEAVK